MSASASSRVMCGGIGGSSGVVIASTITGRSAAKASSHAPSISAAVLTLMPFNPMRLA